MGNLNLNVFFVSVTLVFYESWCNVEKGVPSWNMHERCGETVSTYGGVLNFNAARLRRSHCQITVVGKGSDDTMISMYFSSFNVSNSDCLANVTIEEPGVVEGEFVNPYTRNGLYKTMCKRNEYLVEYSLFTTDHNTLIVKYSSKRDNILHDMKFAMHISTFTSRVRGCSDDEKAKGMFSCHTGRCIHESLLCKDLNPCGDDRDCNVTSASFESNEEKGFNYVTFIVVVVVVVFSVFALIQITLIAKNHRTVCQPKKKKQEVYLQAELMPMTNGAARGNQSAEIIEVMKT